MAQFFRNIGRESGNKFSNLEYKHAKEVQREARDIVWGDTVWQRRYLAEHGVSEWLCHYPVIVGDEMKRMLVREAWGANPHRGVLFQDPFYGALSGAYTACCPSFQGCTAPIGCPRHSGVKPGPWMTESIGWEQHHQGSLNICPPNFPRNDITAMRRTRQWDTHLPVGRDRGEKPRRGAICSRLQGWHKVILHSPYFYRAKQVK